MAKVKDFTGTVSVDTSAEVTPITRQKIEQVTPDKWHLMDVNQLWDQRIILNDRMMKAYQAGHAEIALQVQKGINAIDMFLKQRAAQAEAEAEKNNKDNNRTELI